jgi:hypothetical protein
MTGHDIGLPARRRADGGCLADLACKRATRYQVRLDADAPKPVHREAAVCADHLDGVVRYLRTWATEGDLPDGRLTVSALDKPAGHAPAGCRARKRHAQV